MVKRNTGILRSIDKQKIAMATIQTSNYLPDIQHLLDIQGDDGAVSLEVSCVCCGENRLDISQSARYASTAGGPLQEHVEAHSSLPRHEKFGIERTIAFPCGHVLGDRCVARMMTRDAQCAVCPSCHYKMLYAPCGHPVAPALVPVDGNEPVRDRFPLTIPEGGPRPSACKECRWKAIATQLHFALAADCVLCRQKGEAGMPYSEADHEDHRARHLGSGVRDSLAEIMRLVWPDFVTRETDSSAERAEADADRRQATLSVLVVMVLSEMEDAVWCRTPAKKLSAEHLGRHYAGVSSIEKTLLGWLMEYRGDSRRTW